MRSKHENSIEPAYFVRRFLENGIKNGYTKEEIDALLRNYYSKQETYSKEEIDSLIKSIVLNSAIDDDQTSSNLTWSSNKINEELLLKAEKNNVYNKEEVDQKLAQAHDFATSDEIIQLF